MNINSLNDLEKIESIIESILKNVKFGDLLYSLYQARQSGFLLQDFSSWQVAGLTLFAIKFCPPNERVEDISNYYDPLNLIKLSTDYYLADPIIFDQKLHNRFQQENPVFVFIRTVYSQFPFYTSIFSQFSRPLLLYDEIPKRLQLQGIAEVPTFDFETKFQAINNVSVLDFITLGFFIFSLFTDRQFIVLNEEFFDKLKEIKINKDCFYAVLNQLATNQAQQLELYKKRQNQDRRFRMFDFNPLLTYPIINLSPNQQLSPQEVGLIHAPLPELITDRISSGIFYQMFNEYGTNFSDYFGYVFEHYVGDLLKNCLLSENLFSESDIRVFYPKDKGKAPDWLICDGNTLLLFECKATRFSRPAQAIASESDVNKSLKQIKKGLKQLDEFIEACQNKVSELQAFHHCTVFKPIIISFEPLHLINSTLFQEYINEQLTLNVIANNNWQIISIDELEALQPHIKAGFSIANVLSDLQNNLFNQVLEDLVSKTQKSFKDSFLYPKQEEIYQHIGI